MPVPKFMKLKVVQLLPEPVNHVELLTKFAIHPSKIQLSPTDHGLQLLKFYIGDQLNNKSKSGIIYKEQPDTETNI
jgi:hypothetical protein